MRWPKGPTLADLSDHPAPPSWPGPAFSLLSVIRPVPSRVGRGGPGAGGARRPSGPWRSVALVTLSLIGGQIQAAPAQSKPRGEKSRRSGGRIQGTASIEASLYSLSQTRRCPGSETKPVTALRSGWGRAGRRRTRPCKRRGHCGPSPQCTQWALKPRLAPPGRAAPARLALCRGTAARQCPASGSLVEGPGVHLAWQLQLGGSASP